MDFYEYEETLQDLQKTNQRIKRQLYCFHSLQFLYCHEKYPAGKEYREKFDLPELLDEYSWKANKCSYFLGKYIDGVLKELNIKRQCMGSIHHGGNLFMGKTQFLDEAVYNFDAFVLAASALLEGASKVYMAAYLKRSPVEQYYPKKQEIGLYWQLNLLRNRIIHHTGGRYVNGEICQRFSDFSSSINGVDLKDGHIQLKCTQIDVYQSPLVQRVIKQVLKTGKEDNVFDCLFPNKAAKGYERKNPGMLQLGDSICFDHASTGVKFITEIQQFILKMNDAFFVEFAHKIQNKAAILEARLMGLENDTEVECRVKDLFDISSIPTKK